MKQIILFISVFSVSLQILIAEDGIRIRESISFFSKILNQEVKYSVCLPDDYFLTKKVYPVVYLLHGLGDDESSWLEYGQISQFSDNLVKSKDINPMIFIVPQGFRNYYVNDFAGTFLYQDMFVKELVPLVDSIYRTIPDKQHRALMGYSMGGYGALVIPLKHPEIFSVAVPFSISIRTDEQYMFEDSSEWNNQWGRIFGGSGKIGQERITAYYKENSPFHIIDIEDLLRYKDLKVFIDNGDDEQTLCRSNEELHILMRNKSFSHEYRVRNGGHEFEYWKEALPNGLRFISDAFEGKDYRGDIPAAYPPKNNNKVTIIEKDLYSIILPDDFNNTSRFYPVIYFMGSFNTSEKEEIGTIVNSWTETGTFIPIICVFLKKSVKDDNLQSVISETESYFRVRKGYRFRALIAYGEQGSVALKISLVPLQFTSCVLFDTNPDYEYASKILKEIDKAKTGKTWFFINNPDKGLNFAKNGFLHILFREENLYHEYRVSEGNGDWEWLLSGLYESLIFTQNKIHR